MATINGATLMARSLKQQGVDYMFGIVGFLAVVRQPLGSPAFGALIAGIAVIAGVQVMSWLLGAARRRLAVAYAESAEADANAGMPDWGRRRLLITGSAVGAAALAGGLLGRQFAARSSAAPAAIAWATSSSTRSPGCSVTSARPARRSRI